MDNSNQPKGQDNRGRLAKIQSRFTEREQIPNLADSCGREIVLVSLHRQGLRLLSVLAIRTNLVSRSTNLHSKFYPGWMSALFTVYQRARNMLTKFNRQQLFFQHQCFTNELGNQCLSGWYLTGWKSVVRESLYRSQSGSCSEQYSLGYFQTQNYSIFFISDLDD